MPDISINIMIPVPALEELIRQALVGIESPLDSLDGEAVPTREISWYHVEALHPHD